MLSNILKPLSELLGGKLKMVFIFYLNEASDSYIVLCGSDSIVERNSVRAHFKALNVYSFSKCVCPFNTFLGSSNTMWLIFFQAPMTEDLIPLTE